MDNEIHTDPQDIELTIVESSLLREPAKASQLPAPSVDLQGSHPAGCPPSVLSSPARQAHVGWRTSCHISSHQPSSIQLLSTYCMSSTAGK